MHFWIEFSVSWIWKWVPEVGLNDYKISCLKRTRYVKLWDKLMKIDLEEKKKKKRLLDKKSWTW